MTKKRAPPKPREIHAPGLDAKQMPFIWYRKKPVLVQAMRMPTEFKVKTLEGVMSGKAGDYLIKGVKGEMYPCKPDIFSETYELAEETRREKSENVVVRIGRLYWSLFTDLLDWLFPGKGAV